MSEFLMHRRMYRSPGSSNPKASEEDTLKQNRIRYYTEQLKQIYSRMNQPFARRPLKDKDPNEKIALTISLWKELGVSVSEFEDYFNKNIMPAGTNFHLGAMASMLHSDESDYYAAINALDDDLEKIEHHGILGMKWGIRRYQNPDGSLTELGKERYNDGSGRTQRAIEKFNQQKSIAIAKGDVDFARKNIDYLSNDELTRFKERISARTQLDDLKQASRRVTAEKLKTWSEMAQNGANLLNNGITAYNNAAKIVNSITKRQTIPVLKELKEDNNNNQNKGSVIEVWRMGTRESISTTSYGDDGTKHQKTEYFTQDAKKNPGDNGGGENNAPKLKQGENKKKKGKK